MRTEKPKKSKNKEDNVSKNELDMGINAFGELTTNINLDDLNRFLDKNVESKKLKEHAEKESSKKKESKKKNLK
jgi:hypothetical protein